MSILAIVAEVPLGNTSVKGLMTEGWQYAISFNHLRLSGLAPSSGSLKQLEALLDINFQSQRKVKTPLNPEPVNVIDLIDFEKLLRVLDRKGDENAQGIIDFLVGLSLHQLFCDTLGIKFEKEDRQEYLIQRMQLRMDFPTAIALKEFEKLVAKLDRKGNEQAQEFSRSLIVLSLHQLFCDAFDMKFEKEDRQEYLIQRMPRRQHFHPYLTSWLKRDANGDSNAVDWGWEVNRFKRACNLPLTSVDTWDYDLLSILNRAESGYNMLRIAGLAHNAAIAIIESQH